VPNFPIESSKYNAYVADVEQDLNLPRPIVAGGTGATSADGALDNLSAEKFKQVVSDWDGMVWRAGSFYAATTAVGTAPVTGHAFAGVAYYANATDFVCEATDVTDSANPDKYIRVMAAGVWGPWTRVNPNISSANLGEYTFNNQVTFPPTAGQIRFNNATENSTTEVFISHLTATGFDNTTQITSYLLSGVDFAVQDKDEGNKYKVFTTTAAVVLSGGDFRVTVVLKIAGLDVVSAQRMLVTASGEAQRVQQRQLIYAAPFDALAYNGMQVNGSMEVSQERGLAGTVPANFYVIDGWYLTSSGPGVVLGAQYSSSPSFGIPIIPYCIGITVTTAQASLGASDYYILYQKIEGTRVSRLAWGTASAQPITIGFWTAHHRPGLYSGSVRNDVPNRSYVFTYTQAVADVAQYNVITIPGDVAGTWKIDNTVGLWLTFCIAVGSSNLVTPNVWGAGGAGATGQVNAVAATSDIFRITGVVVLPGIEAPSVARSPLIMRPYDQELLTCRRYYQTLGGDVANDLALEGYGTSSGGVSITVPLIPTMRAAPTLSTTGAFTLVNVAGITYFTSKSTITWKIAPSAIAQMSMLNTTGRFQLDARL
jgi:hypothetical protein